jgi:HD superfamily phosphohydrolase YqeK
LGHKGGPTVILKAVASKDFHIWHAFFGMLGFHNDINILQQSPVFNGIANDTTPPVNFVVNGNLYNMGYYLADKIYPDWSTLMKTRSQPANAKDHVYAKS